MKSLLVALFSLLLFATTIESRGGAGIDFENIMKKVPKDDPDVKEVSDSTPKAIRSGGAGIDSIDRQDIMKDERMRSFLVEVFDSKQKTIELRRGGEIESGDRKNIMKEKPMGDLVVEVSDSAPKIIGGIESVDWKIMMKQERMGSLLVDVSISTPKEKANCRENVKKSFVETIPYISAYGHEVESKVAKDSEVTTKVAKDSDQAYTAKQPFRAKDDNQVYPFTMTKRT